MHDHYDNDKGTWQERFLRSVEFINKTAIRDDAPGKYDSMFRSADKLSECCFDCKVLDLIWILKAIELKGKIK